MPGQLLLVSESALLDCARNISMFCPQEHREQGCDQMTIEQALSITTGETETGQATIQIPASVLQADGQPITYDGQHLTIGGNQVNITVQHMNLDPEGESRWFDFFFSNVSAYSQINQWNLPMVMGSLVGFLPF